MNNKITLVIASTILLMSCYFNSAKAALIQSDYLVLGDNLAVYDEDTNLTWLDLSVTDGIAYEYANTPHNSNGFDYAKSNEVIQLFSGFFGDSLVFSSTGLSTGNTSLAQEFFTLFGSTSTNSSFGFFFDSNNKFSLAGVTKSGVVYTPDFTSNYGRFYTSGNSGVGSYLVKQGRVTIEATVVVISPDTSVSVPEPTSLVILAFGMFGIMARRFS